MKTRMTFRKAQALAVLAMVAAPAFSLAPLPTPAEAHHSAAPFDLTRQVSVRGTVQRWVWSNPHSWLYIEVTKADGTKEIWGLEAGSTNALSRMGWAARDMRPGDVVTASVHPSRQPSRIGLLNQVELPSGRVLSAGFGAAPPAPRG